MDIATRENAYTIREWIFRQLDTPAAPGVTTMEMDALVDAAITSLDMNGPITNEALRRRYTARFARTEPADCPVRGPIVACDMSLECPGHVKIG